MDSLREQGDPPADQLVDDLFAAGSVNAVNALMRTLAENDQPPADGLPPGVKDFLAASAALPDWADMGKIHMGEEVFWKYGPRAVAMLVTYSLPFCYLGAKGVQVLALTARLYSNPQRRIIETAQMVVDVMSPGGLGPAGAGIRTAQRVRLMHAGVRYQILHSDQWNPAWNHPVNHEDQVGTLAAFSWITVDGLRRLGTPVTDDEAEAYIHVWNVVGHLLGIPDTALPASYADAAGMVAAIAKRQFAASPEGEMMTRALVQMLQHNLPGNLLDAAPELLMRYLLGDQRADMLGVGKTNWEKFLLLPLTGLNLAEGEALDHSAAASRLVEIFSQSLIRGFVWVERGGNKPAFSIPTALRETWGVDWVA
jgi:uncharacterized protein (DUF2236 family)